MWAPGPGSICVALARSWPAIWRTCRRRPYDGSVIHQHAPCWALPYFLPAMHLSCCSVLSTPATLSVQMQRTVTYRALSGQSGARAPAPAPAPATGPLARASLQRRPHDSMPCSRRGAHRTPLAGRAQQRPFPGGRAGVAEWWARPQLSRPHGRFRSKAWCRRGAADRIALAFFCFLPCAARLAGGALSCGWTGLE